MAPQVLESKLPYPRIVVILATLICFALSFQTAGAALLSVDELYEVTLIAQPWFDLLLNYRISSQLPHVLITQIFGLIGWDILCLRLSSILAGTLSIPLAYRLARRLFDDRVASLSALLLSLTLTHIHYAAFIRGYSLMIVLSLATILFFIKGMRSGGLRWWIYFALAAVLNIYNQAFAVFLIFPLLIFLAGWAWQQRQHIFSRYKKQLQNIVIGGTLSCLLLLPMFYLVVVQPSTSDNLSVLFGTDWPNSFPPISLEQPANAISPFVQMSYDFSPTHQPGWPTFLFVAYLLIGLIYGLKHIPFRWGATLLTLIMFVPPLLIITATTILQPWFWAFRRFILFVMPPYLMLASVGVFFLTGFLTKGLAPYLKSPRPKPIYLSLFTLLILPVVFTIVSKNLTPSENLSANPYAVARYIHEHARPNDIIICIPDEDWRVTGGREHCSLTLNLYRDLAPNVYYLDQLATYETLRKFLNPDMACTHQYTHLPHPNFDLHCEQDTILTGSANFWLVLWRSRDITAESALSSRPHPLVKKRLGATDVVYLESAGDLPDTLSKAGEIALAESKTPLRRLENFISLATIYLVAGNVDRALATLDEAAFVSRWPEATAELSSLQAQLSFLPLTFKPKITTHVNWDNNLILVGLDQNLENNKPAPGSPTQISLYWQVITPILTEQRIFLHLLNDHNQAVANFDYEPFDGQRPIPAWTPGQVIRETRTFNWPDNLLPGAYRLVIGIYNPNSLERMQITGDIPKTEWLLAEWQIN
ncbi:MAG: glycosyltransferase family 39 protein [Chloroflexota bacterium]